MDVRVILDAPAEGAWNMAVDEALLERAGHDGPVLRFYGWSEPTLSLGYFQRLADRRSHPASAECPVVRRASGGGAILHDHELTYAFAAPARNRASAESLALYDLFHRALIAALDDWGVTGRSCDGLARQGSQADAFLCFARRAPGDVLIGEHKVAGSAQRRRRDALLQHGSVLLDRSDRAPELPGINQFASAAIAADQLVQGWLEALGRARPDWCLQIAGWSAGENERAMRIHRRQFASARWTNRR